MSRREKAQFMIITLSKIRRNLNYLYSLKKEQEHILNYFYINGTPEQYEIQVNKMIEIEDQIISILERLNSLREKALEQNSVSR